MVKHAALPHVVIIGGGFAGLTAAKELDGARVRVTLVDRLNHHLFQPLLYQVAMAGLSPADIAAPIRSVVRFQPNVSVLLAEVQDISVTDRVVKLDRGELSYDYLIVCAGAQNHYFGHDDWAKYAVGLKDLDDAVEVRRRVLLAFEAAERTPDPTERERLLTFVVVGGGPTGVELAGALGELSRHVLARDFRNIDPAHAKIILIEGGERILTSFPDHLAMRAVRDLGQLGVEVRCNLRVSKIDGRGVEANGKQIPTATVLWAAGVRGSPLGAKLGGEVDRQGRVVVNPDLSVGSHREVFAIGDMAAFLHQDGKPLPGVSPVAIQQAKKVIQNLFADLEGQPRTPFAYFDKGSMATIGRAAAIAHIGRLQIGGFFAWLLWLLVHIFFLITFRNRVAVLFNWAYQYFTYKRGARLITGHRLKAGAESDVAISALPRSALTPAIVAGAAPPAASPPAAPHP
ncbi:MAG: NAD(P)/FAD-dependent oxidoreductase [Myxococcales bacterium]|nr:NAD(P)/FAD-dependent oxidoreductase [Myxococcales bacterium]